MKNWMKLIPAAELAFYAKAGFHGDVAMGQRPALIVVDVTLGFTGSEGLTLDQAIAEYPPACGPASWKAMPKIARLIGLFRSCALPVVFTRSCLDDIPFTGKATKAKRKAGPVAAGFNDFPAAIAPGDGEWILEKVKASAFFGTPLTSYLVGQRVDTAVVCGVSTSGCVRATVVDAFSHGYPTFVVDDCCFDRSEFAHAANLFDISGKYASVLSLEDLTPLLAPARSHDQSLARST